MIGYVTHEEGLSDNAIDDDGKWGGGYSVIIRGKGTL